MNALSLTSEIRIEGTHDDPCMFRLRQMQANKVFAIESKHGPMVSAGEGKHGFIRNCLPGLTRFRDGQFQGTLASKSLSFSVIT